MMKKTKGSRNVYADLGMADSGEMLVKAQLASTISEIIKRRRMTPALASVLLDMPETKLTDMLQGRFRGISGTSMLQCVTRLGRDVQIVVGPATRRRAPGRVSIAFSEN